MFETMTDEKLFLLDAYALIFRAYFALARNPLINSKRQNVSAISGFTSTLYELISKEKPTHLAVVFDLGGATHREAEYADYKANRAETPEDILFAVPYIKEIIRAWHIPILEFEGYEADDLIGTIAKQKAREGHTVYMVTSDKDYAQLVEEKIFIYKPGRSGGDAEIIGIEEVKRDWEVKHPQQVIDILAMWGDAVDNIPGIPGVGEKTAKKFIKEFGSLENTIAHASLIKGKVGENVKTFAQQGLLSKRLATINLHVPIYVSDDDLKIDAPDKEKLAKIFDELEFRTLKKRILGEEISSSAKPAAPTDLFGNAATNTDTDTQKVADEPTGPRGTRTLANISNTPHQYHIIQHESELQALTEKLLQQTEFCFDTETTSLDYFSLELVGISFAWKKNEGYYVPCPKDRDATLALLEILRPALQNPTITKIGQNIKYDMHVLQQYGIAVTPPIYDTMLAHYLLEPDMKHGMDFLSETYLGYTPISITELIGKKGKNQVSMRDVPLEKIAPYAAEDADITYQLKQVIAPIIQQREVESVLQHIELPLVPVLAAMEREGVRIDDAFLRDYATVLQKELVQLESEIYELAGIKFNIDSPKQMGDVLFKHLQLTQNRKTSTGQASTGEDVLLKLAKEHPIAGKILDYREVAKLKSTYVEALPQMINKVTGRVHTTFNQTIAATGRLSSLQPNLQNIPIRTERGRQVRKAFIPRSEEYILLSADYSQIELRLVAEMSGDKSMLEAFENGLDIHTATAAKVYNVPYDQVTKEMRYKAKSVNFGILYGQGAFGLAENLGIPRSEAKAIIDNYNLQFAGIKKFMNDNIEFARANGYVKTMMGRRRYLKDINSKNFAVRGFAERNAINAPVQGSAADMIKLAMIGIHRELQNRQLKTRMTLQVHDELLFDAHLSEIDIIQPIIREQMIGAIKTKVPIEVSIGIGENWLAAH